MNDLKQSEQRFSDGQFYDGKMTSDWMDGQRLDTHVEINLDLWIAGNMTEAFRDQLKKLIDEFAI